MAARTVLPPPLQDRPFTVAEALALGVPRTSLRGRAFRRPFRGVRVPAHLPDDLEVRCAAALLVLPPGAAFCGPTALALARLPRPRRSGSVLADPLHARVTDPGRVPHLPGVRAGEGLDPRQVWRGHPRGLPLLHPAHAWAELAPDLPHVDAVALGDAVRRRWADDRRLAEVVAARGGRPGVVRLREVLADVRYRVDSPPETEVRLVLQAAGLPRPCCGQVVTDGAGGWVAEPDLSWPEHRVAAEYDGEHHRTDRRQWARDILRKENLEALGWRVVVITAEDLRRPTSTVERVRWALRSHGAAV